MATNANIVWLSNGKLLFWEYQHYDGYLSHTGNQIQIMASVGWGLLKDTFEKMEFFSKGEYKKYLSENGIDEREAKEKQPWNFDDKGIEWVFEWFEYGRRNGMIPVVVDEPYPLRIMKKKRPVDAEYIYAIDIMKRTVSLYLNPYGSKGGGVKNSKGKNVLKAARVPYVGIFVGTWKFNEWKSLQMNELENHILDAIENADVMEEKMSRNRHEITMKEILLG